MAVPELSREQRLEALEQAKSARLKRANIKSQLASGELTIAQVIAMKDDEAVGKLKVSDMIAALPHYGEAKTAKIMEELKISPSRRIRGLGKRQEADLLERLGNND